MSFNSPEGRAIFDRAMSYGRNMGKESTMDSFFLLISHLVTQVREEIGSDGVSVRWQFLDQLTATITSNLV